MNLTPSVAGEYEDTFATIRQILVQRTIIKNMLKNNGAVEETPYFKSEGAMTESVNHLVSGVLQEWLLYLVRQFCSRNNSRRVLGIKLKNL